MKNFTKTFLITVTIFTLMLTLFETTKNVHAANYKKVGNNIFKIAKR